MFTNSKHKQCHNNQFLNKVPTGAADTCLDMQILIL